MKHHIEVKVTQTYEIEIEAHEMFRDGAESQACFITNSDPKWQELPNVKLVRSHMEVITPALNAHTARQGDKIRTMRA